MLRSYDAGATWKTIHAMRMAVDIELIPQDTNRIFVTHGSLNDEVVSGIYRSDDGGSTFKKLTNGTPPALSGKILLAAAPSQPGIIYASAGNAFSQDGLYRTLNYGDTWTKVNTQDVCRYQGWYSHDVAVHPLQPNTLIWVGIDTWKSVNGGASVTKKSNWSSWFFGEVPAGGPEGPPDYVHADIHRVYFPTNDPNKLYLVTDGGIFVSYNAGETFQGRNGGYQTQQFYANLGYSTTNPKRAIGGMQDNSTAIYSGSASWRRVLGGDGQCAAIHPHNDSILYGSYQYLNMARSNDGGNSFDYFSPAEANSENPAFNGPFELAPASPNVVYAAAQNVFRSEDGGDTWETVTAQPLNETDPVITIAVDARNTDRVWCSTAPSSDDSARVFLLHISTQEVRRLYGLPNRYCMDIALHPTDENIAYAAFAGFNTRHVYKTTDGGTTWQAADAGLPDVPTNTLLLDPKQPEHVYVGNDIGVWFSADGGASWAHYSAQAPKSLLVMHLGLSADRRLCVGTYGLGVWQTAMVYQPVRTSEPPSPVSAMQVFPNPVGDRLRVRFTLTAPAAPGWQITDALGRVCHATASRFYGIGEHQTEFETAGLAPGLYYLWSMDTRGERALEKTGFVKL
jgi:photosystem II stability/assembly factor-like uncharacterized protein